MRSARNRRLHSLVVICIAMAVSVVSAACDSTTASTAPSATVTGVRSIWRY